MSIEWLGSSLPVISKDRNKAAQVLGCFIAFSCFVDGQVFGLTTEPNRLLFSLKDGKDKEVFMELCEVFKVIVGEISIPTQSEIDMAQPIAQIVPADIYINAEKIGFMVFSKIMETALEPMIASAMELKEVEDEDNPKFVN